jgi:integrase/recombinase XerD
MMLFNERYILHRGYSASYQNEVVNAVKLYYRTICDKQINTGFIERPRRSYVLPNVLSKEEVKRIITISLNIKHGVMLSLIYSCGLRRSELLNMKITDIDLGRGSDYSSREREPRSYSAFIFGDIEFAARVLSIFQTQIVVV